MKNNGYGAGLDQALKDNLKGFLICLTILISNLGLLILIKINL